MKSIELALLVSSMIFAMAANAAEAEQETVPAERMAARKAYGEMKFGIFLHWGIYATYAQGEWYQEVADVDPQEYAKAANAFYPHDFNAREWARKFKAAGARYVVFTSRHHDGFSMWATKASKYNIVDATPFKRDVVKELADACRAEGLKFGLYYSLLDWHRADYPTGGAAKTRKGFDKSKEDYDAYHAFMKRQLTELLTNYGDIVCIWFDGEWDHPGGTGFDWRLEELYDLIHSLQPKCLVVNNHHHSPRPGEDVQTFERDVPGENKGGYSAGQVVAKDYPLETSDTMAWGAWGYQVKAGWMNIWNCRERIGAVNSKGANMLFNIGPRPDGRLPDQAVELLDELAK